MADLARIFGVLPWSVHRLTYGELADMTAYIDALRKEAKKSSRKR